MKSFVILGLTMSFILQPGCKSHRTSPFRQIIVFHAGSLSVPIKKAAEEYEKQNPGVKILLEPAGSIVCARKITELKKPCDIIASADYFVIDKMLIPEYTDWSVRFATNEIVIAFQDKSRYSGEIDSTNWMDILLRNDVTFARSDPDSDPGGYRSVFTCKLAEKYYNRPGLAEKLLSKNTEFIRPKEVDLVALIQANAVDYMFQYKSVAIQHDLKYIVLPDEINLSDPLKNNEYKSVSLEVAGNSPGSRITVTGEYINYSISVLRNAPDKNDATDFVSFLIGNEGRTILLQNGQDPLVPAISEQPQLVPAILQKYLRNNEATKD
jgi:molybdate/tungstate transport system substrate-binding protein